MTLVKYWAGQLFESGPFHLHTNMSSMPVYLASDIDPWLAALKWTKEKPTVTGYFWFKIGNRKPRVLFVDEFQGRLFADGGVQLTDDYWASGEWAGPLTVPPGRMSYEQTDKRASD